MGRLGALPYPLNQPDLDTSDGFPDWLQDGSLSIRLERLVFSSKDRTLKARYRRFRRLGQSKIEAARRALEMHEEDRQAASLEGPLRIVDGKLVYFPVPGEKRLPWDPPEDS